MEMYYVRRRRRAQDPHVDALDRLRKWGFEDRITDSRDKQRLLEFLRTRGPRRQKRADQLADILATTVLRVGGGRPLPRDLVPAALRDLLALMPELDCQPLSHQSFRELPGVDCERRVVAVLGCQTEEILLGRVKAAHRLVRELAGDVTVVFSGKHPPRRKLVRVIHESETMAALWEDLSRRKKWPSGAKPHLVKVVLEGGSADTQENIREILRHPRIFSPGVRHLMALVTSSFHLPRVAAEFDLAVRGAQPKPQLGTVVFVPSETDMKQSLLGISEYRRATLYEVYRHVVAHMVGSSAAYIGRTAS